MNDSTEFASKDTDGATIITKDGREVPFSWLQKKQKAETAARRQLRYAICNDFVKYRKEFPDKIDDEIRALICERREVKLVVVNNALVSQGNGLNPKTRAELDAKILVSEQLQIDRLDEALRVIGDVVEDVLSKPDQTHWELERTEETNRAGGNPIIKSKQLPTKEYVMRLVGEQLRVAKIAAESIRAFQGNKSDTNINLGVVLTQSQREERMGKARDRFNIQVEGGAESK